MKKFKYFVFFFNLKLIILLTTIINESYEANIGRGGYRPYFIDNSTSCTIYYYTASRVIKNCSSLNLAQNSSILSINNLYITELNLSNNSFSLSLPYNLINTYESLHNLDLSSNLINEYTTDLQMIDCTTTCIKIINLSSNLFSKFPQFSQTCSSLIQVLNLSNNTNLINIDQDINSYRQLSNLNTLDLSNCRLEYLNQNNATILSKFPNLNYLNLIGNRIKNIYPNPFIWTPYLNTLSFEQNKIECSSSIIWIKYFLLNKNPKILGILPSGNQSSQAYEPTCFNILTNSTQNIVKSDNSSFYTDIYLATSINNRNLRVMSGKSLDMDCQQYSIPASDLWWTFNDRVLSRTVTPDSPYEFIENFNQTLNPNNKTSILRIRSINQNLAGTYSCKALYSNVDINQFNNITGINFQVQVDPNPNQAKALSAGEIAAIVIGSVLGFLLLSLLLFLLVCCCCYRRGCCCFAKKSATNTSSSSSTDKKYAHSSTINSTRYLTQNSSFASLEKNRNLAEMDDNASGFHDLSGSKPNYVINTISKNTNILNRNNDTNGIWQGRANTNESSLSPRYNNQNILSNSIFQDQETHVYNVKNPQNRGYTNSSSTNKGYISDNLDSGMSQQNIPRSPDSGHKYVETTQYSSNRYIPSSVPLAEGEFINENFFTQVIIDDDNYMPTRNDNNNIYNNKKQYKINSLEKTDNLNYINQQQTSSYQKYDSDV